MKLTEACINKPVFAWMLMAGTVLFGIVAASRIGISQMPDVDFPTINVSVNWEGAAPEVVENDVLQPLEEALVQVEGVTGLTSTARQGGGSVTVELDLSRDVDLALQDVTAKVQQAARRLPRDIDPPVISKSNPEDQPIMWIGLTGPYSRQFIADYARYRVKERLQTVPGIGEITEGGSIERNVRIWVDSSALDSRNLTVGDVTRALVREHVELPAGRIEVPGREVNVRVLGEAMDLETLQNIVVAEGGAPAIAGRATSGGTPVYLKDVALVEDGFEDIRRASRFNGQPAQGLGIRKQRGANAVAVARAIRAEMAEIGKTLPPGMSLETNFDSTLYIEESVNEIEFELFLAVLLTALVCWLFLGSLSSTLNVVLAIPMSLLGTVAVIYFLGFTLNTFTLLALGLSVGIVVDDAIMVLENIFRHAESGEDRVTAAREGTREIAFAALAATLAVCAIFIPVVFMEGIVGKFFLQFGVTLCVAVLLSYLEAVTLAPARCSQILDVSRERRSRVGRAVDEGFRRLARLYSRVLPWALRRPVRVIAGSFLLFALAIVVFRAMPKEMVPSQDQSRVMIRLTGAVGSDLAETDRLVRRGEEYLLSRPDVLRVFSVAGGFGGGGVNTGVYFVTLVPPGERAATQAQWSSEVRKELNSYPGQRAVVQDLSQQGFTAQRGFPVEFSVRGSDWNQLIGTSQQLMSELKQSGLVVDLDSDYQLGMPELSVLPDRARAADLGVGMDDIATSLNALVGGVRVGKYSAGGRRYDVRLRLLAGQRSRPEDLAHLRVRASTGELVPLSALVSTEERPALQAITRRDRERAITVFANVAPGSSQDKALAKVEELAKSSPLGVRVVLGGASVAFRDSMSSLLFALVLGIIVAYMILASQFNSFLHPVTVLTILPLSIAGAAFALWGTGRTLNIFSMIGLLLLMGIVKKNSIILVDYANQLREKGRSAAGAILRAGPVRLRPILMTSAATMMAAFPAALGLGAGSETRAPMAVAVIGGLIVSTALSLLVVPAFYLLAARGKERLRARRARRSPGFPARAPSTTATRP
ncbi:MAG: efflux RND transporter permease subunit [Thermoanaerobaculia bacterium]|jgi:hydrophobe/amphiphile efflux-1 (HAE1) family protein|nr:efflux RND transporter permease subunit [Thermoanaerobaculia bacterium]